jgi:LysM repeat protein
MSTPAWLYRSVVFLVGALVVGAATAGCFFGGDDGGTPSADRPQSIPTATVPAPLPAPIDLGSQATVGGGDGGGGGTTTNPGETTYLVQSGDTLLAIALQLGIPTDEQPAWINQVLELNNLPSAAALQAGVEIRVPKAGGGIAPAATPSGGSQPAPTATPEVVATAPAEQPTQTGEPTVAGGGGTYTVESGDYPLLIAEKLGVPPSSRDAWAAELVALNNVDPTALSVGQVLELPADTPGQTPAATATPIP